MVTVTKDKSSGVWTVHDELLHLPASTWQEAQRVARDRHRVRALHRLGVPTPIELRSMGILAEEYTHLRSCGVSAVLSMERLGKIYGLAPHTVSLYLARRRKDIPYGIPTC